MNKMQRAFAEIGIPIPKKDEGPHDVVISRRGTISDVEGRNPMLPLFGQWVNQLQRPEINIDRAHKKLSPKELRERKDANRRLKCVNKPAKVKESIAVVAPVVHEKTYCIVTSKRQYTIAGARRALQSTIDVKNHKVPIRMYECDHCKMYHLSSKK